MELTEEEDVLEAGIRIISQPPGKKTAEYDAVVWWRESIDGDCIVVCHSESEAVSVLSFDEIEAALDDSNVTRFAQYLHKLTKNTQFIIITHRRGTMNAADRLYGITMQEKGVSVGFCESDRK